MRINWKKLAEDNNLTFEELTEELFLATATYMQMYMKTQDTDNATVQFSNMKIVYTLDDSLGSIVLH